MGSILASPIAAEMVAVGEEEAMMERGGSLFGVGLENWVGVGLSVAIAFSTVVQMVLKRSEHRAEYNPKLILHVGEWRESQLEDDFPVLLLNPGAGAVVVTKIRDTRGEALLVNEKPEAGGSNVDVSFPKTIGPHGAERWFLWRKRELGAVADTMVVEYSTAKKREKTVQTVLPVPVRNA